MQFKNKFFSANLPHSKNGRPAATILREFALQILLGFSQHMSIFLLHKKVPLSTFLTQNYLIFAYSYKSLFLTQLLQLLFEPYYLLRLSVYLFCLLVYLLRLFIYLLRLFA